MDDEGEKPTASEVEDVVRPPGPASAEEAHIHKSFRNQVELCM